MGDLVTDDAASARRAEIGGGGLRARVAGGTIVNTVFLLSMNALSIVSGLVLAGILGAAEYGLWGLIIISFGTLFTLAAIGFDDKYIQQDHADQQAAFEIAFTLQAILCGAFTVIALVAIPLFSVLYEQPRILVPGMLLALAMPLIALQSPIWVFYRRMDFARQRMLESISPVLSTVVTLGLALAGMGFWSYVIGTMAGSIVATAVVVRNSPYPLRFRYETGAMREYVSFSWPLMLSSITGVLSFQVPLTIAARTLGSGAVGALSLSSQITQYTRRVDDIVSHALYPAVCAVKDRTDLLFESFSKSNRLALLWGFPVGVGAALFADPAVPLVLGERWRLAVPLIQVLGLAAAVEQIGFNWTTFARARGDTRILAVGAVAATVAVLGVGVPLLLSRGLQGFALGLGAGTLATLVVRGFYLSRLFPTLRILRHVLPPIVPTLVAAPTVLAVRAVGGHDLSAGRLLLEAAAYAVVVAALTLATERPLLRETFSYARRAVGRGPAQTPTAAAS